MNMTCKVSIPTPTKKIFGFLFVCRRNWGWHAFESGQELVLYSNQDINHHRIGKEKAWILFFYNFFQSPYYWSIDCNYVFWLVKKLKHDPMFALLARLDCQICSSLWEHRREYGHIGNVVTCEGLSSMHPKVHYINCKIIILDIIWDWEIIMLLNIKIRNAKKLDTDMCWILGEFSPASGLHDQCGSFHTRIHPLTSTVSNFMLLEPLQVFELNIENIYGEKTDH